MCVCGEGDGEWRIEECRNDRLLTIRRLQEDVGIGLSRLGVLKVVEHYCGNSLASAVLSL